MTNTLIPLRKLIQLLFSIALLASAAFGQVVTNSALLEREAEWHNYRLPSTNFHRLTVPDEDLLFRVPSDWKQLPNELTFEGPHSAQLKIFTEKVPDGVPLSEYVNSLVRNLRGTPGVAAVLNRRTQIQNLETREISIEAPNAEGELTRTVFWVAVRGPKVVAFILLTPVAHAAEIEPYYKAFLQSVMFVHKSESAAFETIRLAAIKKAAPAPVDEIETIAATLDQVTTSRDTAIVRLSAILTANPDIAIDLLLDRRPLIRGTVVEAIALSKNATLNEFLWRAVGDPEPLVAEHAARALANLPNVVGRLSTESFEGFHTQTIARVWPFLDKDKRVQILQEIFSRTAATRTKSAKTSKTREEVEITVTELIPVGRKKPKTEFTAFASLWSTDPRVQLGALTLLTTVPASEFKLPLARLVAANHDPLTVASLQVALARNEVVATEILFKLVASGNEQIRGLAAQNLALSAGLSDIARIEGLIAKGAVPIALTGTKAAEPTASESYLSNELTLTIKKIRFRDQVATADKESSNARLAVIKRGLADPQLADFVWLYFGAQSPRPREIAKPFAIKSMAENLLPERLEHFVALPNPAQATQRFYETLQGIQMESARTQMSLVLAFSGIRQMLAQQMGAAPNASSILEFTGIKADSPISLAAWNAEGTSSKLATARRRAVVLRVADRARLEQTVQTNQGLIGSFGALPDYFGVVTRAFVALPSLLPLSARFLLADGPPAPKQSTILNYSMVSPLEFNATRIKAIEQRRVYADGRIEFTITYLAYVGEMALLTPDLATMKELLDRAAATDGSTLAANAEFQRSVAGGGDVIYFSDLQNLFQQIGEPTPDGPSFNLREAGALRFAKTSWENSHRITFNESDWSKPLLPFHPKELSAPADLLPSSTLAYGFVKVDLKTAWTAWAKRAWEATVVTADEKKWGLKLEQEVLPELGPECGAAILDLAEVNANNTDPSWAVFCKMKSPKLETAIAAGDLFPGTPVGKGILDLKLGNDSYFVTTKNGFFIVSNRSKGLEQLDQKDKLLSSRDYSRAAEKVPSGIVSFAGYNLEAAVATVKLPDEKGSLEERANFVSSLASAFHSQNFYAVVTAGSIEAQSSVAMDRQGRYSIGELLDRPRGSTLTYATVEPRGLPIGNQKRLSKLEVLIRTKTAGAVDRIKEDITSPDQLVEQKSDAELIVKVAARRSTPQKFSLPITDPSMATFVQSTREFPASDEQVAARAREIAGDDRDAWSVAQKLAAWTYKNLEWKFTASADAAQTLATREADCSEFSQLFVSMARSVGLPARLVSGLAYSGSSFGGHAWVEVWIGRWIELDPTWGTDFVDATHIRNASGALLTYGALDLIELEVLKAEHSIADFQLTPKSLVEELSQSITIGETGVLESGLDLAVLTDELMGKGSWATMNDSERDQMASAYSRVLLEVGLSYKKDTGAGGLRSVHVSEKGERAEALCLTGDNDLVKMKLLRVGKVWYLTEILQVDWDLSIVAEIIRPTIQTIVDRRAGRKPQVIGTSDYVRLFTLIEKAGGKAIELADQMLKDDPGSKRIRFLKGVALLSNEDTVSEGEKLLGQLAADSVRLPFSPAVFRLANWYKGSDDEGEGNTSVQLFERYVSLEPFDPRGHLGLAEAYESVEKVAEAEVANRKVIELDPANVEGYQALITQLVSGNRVSEAGTVLTEADKHLEKDSDLFGLVMRDLGVLDDPALVIRFAASQSERMKTSMNANILLAWAHIESNQPLEAIPILKRAALLDSKSADPFVVMAQAYRKLSRWSAALTTSDQALLLDPKNADAHYQRACALARLRRPREAMTALSRAIELEPIQALFIEEEKDFQSLRSLPEFQKLIPEDDKEKSNP